MREWQLSFKSMLSVDISLIMSHYMSRVLSFQFHSTDVIRVDDHVGDHGSKCSSAVGTFRSGNDHAILLVPPPRPTAVRPVQSTTQRIICWVSTLLPACEH